MDAPERNEDDVARQLEKLRAAAYSALASGATREEAMQAVAEGLAEADGSLDRVEAAKQRAAEILARYHHHVA